MTKIKQLHTLTHSFMNHDYIYTDESSYKMRPISNPNRNQSDTNIAWASPMDWTHSTFSEPDHLRHGKLDSLQLGDPAVSSMNN